MIDWQLTALAVAGVGSYCAIGGVVAGVVEHFEGGNYDNALSVDEPLPFFAGMLWPAAIPIALAVATYRATLRRLTRPRVPRAKVRR